MRTLPAGDGEEHDELRRRLARLDRRGVVDSVRVRTWPHEVVVDGPQTRRDRIITERLRAFERWAVRERATLPAFRERTTAGVGRMGPQCTVVRLPQTALAVFRDDRLLWVAPCVFGEETWTPREWIENAADGTAPGCETGPVLIV